MNMKPNAIAEFWDRLGDLFFGAWLAMLLWGMLLHATQWNLPFISYREMLLLKLVVSMLQAAPIRH